MDDVAVRLEHVDLLNLSDGLDVHLLEGGLELLVVGARGPVHLLLDTSGSTLAAVPRALACVHMRIAVPVPASGIAIALLSCQDLVPISHAQVFLALQLRFFHFQAPDIRLRGTRNSLMISLTLWHCQHCASADFADFRSSAGAVWEHLPVRTAFCMRASFSVSMLSAM